MFAGPLGRSTFTPPKSSFDSPLYGLVSLRRSQSFLDKTLWPEYLQLKDALDEYLNEATERIIREEVHRDTAEAPERAR